MADQTVLPRWRGFNLLELYTRRGPENWRGGASQEDDFRWIAEWGFDFVRIPLDYTLWIEGRDPYTIKEAPLEQLDRVVRLGEQYGLHVCLNFHAAPGYCVNPKDELYNLWKIRRRWMPSASTRVSSPRATEGSTRGGSASTSSTNRASPTSTAPAKIMSAWCAPPSPPSASATRSA